MGWFIFGLIVALIIQGIFAAKFSSIAEEKGYYGTSFFWLCFLLGVIGYCMVAALPDETLREEIKNLKKINSNIVQTEPSAGNWICKSCGTSNNLNYGQCKKCGNFKS